MIKKIVLFFACVFPLFSFCESESDIPIWGWYVVRSEKLIPDYQKYVGKTVIYLGKDVGLIGDEIKIEHLLLDTEYVITNISPKFGGDSFDKDITITFQDKNGGKKIKERICSDWILFTNLFLIDDFNAAKPSIIGRKFKDSLVKGEYEVTDVKLEMVDGHNKRINFYVSNPEIGKSFTVVNLRDAIKENFAEDKKAGYRTTLVKVEKPEDSSNRYGDFKTLEEDSLTKYSFEDNHIGIVIFSDGEKFNFRLKNKSKSSIKVIWDDAAFVDFNGTTSKIMHAGTKYSQRESSQPASTIISGASLNDIACPISNVRYSAFLEDWVIEPMYPDNTSQTNQVRLMLPIQIKDVVNEYIFVFDVKYEYYHPERLNLPEATK